MAHGYLVVATVTQCYLYRAGNWLSPVVFDVPKEGTISLIKQSDKYVLLVDTQEGIQVLRRECRELYWQMMYIEAWIVQRLSQDSAPY